ncbi:hypothetical protein [Actinomadura hibisca]|uniref:hypothetical protein n=1 Tax=Actinomadura hibisca TaxID=68565 RepID=UPI00082A7E56|nr:hypothetical protein [Actinomadura hibisca]
MGDELEVGPPFGDVVLEDGDDPLVLVSAGIGVTPAAAMLDHLAAVQPEREVLFLHADRSPVVHALREQVAASLGRMPRAHAVTWYEKPGGVRGGGVLEGRIDVGALPVPLPAKARAYLCGPIPFMRGVRRGLLAAGVGEERIRYEVFGPDLWNQAD